MLASLIIIIFLLSINRLLSILINALKELKDFDFRIGVPI